MSTRAPRSATSGSSSGSEPTSPEFSPLKPSPNFSSTSLGCSRVRHRRFYPADVPASPDAAKRRLLADALFGGFDRMLPSLAAMLIALFLVFHLLSTGQRPKIDLSPIGFAPYPGNRMSNAQVVAELQNWKDPEFASSRIKVYYYDLPPKFNQELVDESHRNPPKIRDPFCDESFYSAEYTIANHFKNSPVRTMNASEADYFYVPILSTCYLMTNLPNDVEKTGAFFEEAMDVVINEFPYWNQSDGRDHVFMFAQGFGARLSGDWTKYRHATFLVHNGDYDEDHFNTHKDIVVPPDLSHYLKPVGLTHPGRLLQKKNFVLFGGQILNTSISDHRGSNYSGGVRQFIQSDLAGVDGYKVTGVRSTSYIQDMLESVFCLAPHGWHKWSPRPAYAVLLGCIPVVISEKQELFLEDLVDYSEISYWVKPEEIRELDKKLRGVGHQELTRRERGMRDVWKLFWYGPEGLAEQAILYSLHQKMGSSKPTRWYI